MPSAQIVNTCTHFNPLGGAVEIIPDRLYYASYSCHPSTFPKPQSRSRDGNPNRPIHYFCVDNELVYWNFLLDFGPLNLGQLYRFCMKLNRKLNSDAALAHKHICFFSGPSENKRANAVFLICAYQVLYLNRKPEDALHLLRSQIKSLPPFHDASNGRCTYDLTVLDCVKALVRAKKYRFFDFDDFQVEEYEYFEQVENGDMNWIIKDKIVAFAGPQNHRVSESRGGHHALSPESYVPYFRKNKIGLVVRLNETLYDSHKFTRAGINHFDRYYQDGSCPPMHVLQSILDAFETVPADKAFAVHCKAGLGRTGTCIGAYLMKHYKFTAAEAIGWMRICRPGMVIGPQQHFLKDIEKQMWHEGDLMGTSPQRSLPSRHYGKEEENQKNKEGNLNMLADIQLGPLSLNDQIERNCGRPGQADELLARRWHGGVRGVNV